MPDAAIAATDADAVLPLEEIPAFLYGLCGEVTRRASRARASCSSTTAEENLLALEAILEPLGHRLVSVTSGAAALKELLLGDFACILLDVQMPDLDGFELAELIKRRERSQHIPIIFVTALSKEEQHVYRGYSAGAVDYIFKPIDPDILRSKVSVFVELWEKSRQLQRAGRAAARAGARRARARERGALPAARRRDAADRVDSRTRRRRDVLQPALVRVHRHDAGGRRAERLARRSSIPTTCRARSRGASRRSRAASTFEVEYRFRGRDGDVPLAPRPRGADARPQTATIEFWVGTATDIHDRKLIEDQRTLHRRRGRRALALARLPRDARAGRRARRGRRSPTGARCTSSRPDGTIARGRRRAHADPAKVTFARELQERYPPDAGRADRRRRR